MKTEELNVLKNEAEALDKKLAQLTEEELKLVSGGVAPIIGSERDVKNEDSCPNEPNIELPVPEIVIPPELRPLLE